ncbi:MAG: NifB/NifX family molybdenum-iron cluster-binding protein [Eubacterium sp.]|nr:NifB/NifX family molybdenum-iron cluster-binding protein [Eubacterium sp.]
MKIAVTYEDGSIFQHFGHTEKFKLYEAENGSILNQQVVSAEGFGHGALAGFLNEINADVLICGGIGQGAIAALEEAGIKVCGGISGSADEAVEKYISRSLIYSSEPNCSHHHDHDHHHHHGGHCGGHNGCHGKGGSCHE